MKDQVKAGSTVLAPHTQTGTPSDPANLRRAFRALLKAAGIPAKQPAEDCPRPGQWHPNDMRHSAGSYMDAMGVPPKRVASILGHEGTRTAEGVYIHGQEIIDMTSAGFARTADLVHAIWRQHVHPRVSLQVTVLPRSRKSAGVRVSCCTFVLYGESRRGNRTVCPCIFSEPDRL